jgi:hypothetical protein
MTPKRKLLSSQEARCAGVRVRWASCVALHFACCAWALPPDVRHGFALPTVGVEKEVGLRPWFGLWACLGRARTGGVALGF